MSWDKTYSHNFLIALDSFAAAVVFNRPDLTVSTMCWMVMTGNDASLKLWGWQRWILVTLGPWLNDIQANHCALAAAGDRERAQSTIEALKALPGGSDMQAALKDVAQAFLEFRHAQSVGPGWFTRGDAGLYNQVNMWLKRGADAVQRAQAIARETP
jgi:hypothetical protein